MNTHSSTEDIPVILACTVSHNLQDFSFIIPEIEETLGDSWGDMSFEEASDFLSNTEAAMLGLIIIAVNSLDNEEYAIVADIVRKAHTLGIKTILVSVEINTDLYNQILRLGINQHLEFPLNPGVLAQAIIKLNEAGSLEASTSAANSNALRNREKAVRSKKKKHRNSSVGDSTKTIEQNPVKTEYSDDMPEKPLVLASGNRSFPENDPSDRNPQNSVDTQAEKTLGTGLIISVCGFAGGTGATTLAVNLAWHLSSLGGAETAPRVCILDLDVQFGSVASFLGIENSNKVSSVLTQPRGNIREDILAVFQPFSETLDIFSAPLDIMALDSISCDTIAELIAVASVHYDYVIIDTPKTATNWTQTIIEISHILLGMVELDRRCLMNFEKFKKNYYKQFQEEDKIHYVLNRAPKRGDPEGQRLVTEIKAALGISFELELYDCGPLIDSVSHGSLPLPEATANTALNKKIQEFAQSIHTLNQIPDEYVDDDSQDAIGT